MEKCIFCEMQVDNVDEHGRCTACITTIDMVLPKAWIIWHELRDMYAFCCGGLISGEGTGPHLHFHGKHFTSTYKGLRVEAGVLLFPRFARPYYMRDFGHTCDIVPYGDSFKYPKVPFWEPLDRGLRQAAGRASLDGLTQCESCGYHVLEAVGHPECFTPEEIQPSCNQKNQP